jgi:hypothetical protein
MNRNYREANTWYITLLKEEIKRRLYVLIAIFCIAVLVAIGQSNRFVSSLWVMVEFGFNYWEKHIRRMFDNFYWWAIISGVVAAAGAFAGSTTTDIKKISVGTSIGFVVGFAFTFLLVVTVAIILYIPLGMFSFVFPDQIHFLSMGFAFLCSTYIVFTLIAIDTPPLLFAIIKSAPPYLKMLAALFGILLASQTLSMIISILQILIEYSVWRVHFLAFSFAFGLSLLVSVLINLRVLRNETKYKKVAIIVSVYLLSIITGNSSENIFHWGEFGSAFVAAFLGPIAYSSLLYQMQKNIVGALSIAAGGICGFGAGLFIANYIGLSIIGQGWFGIICGATIALGFGISFGFILGPRIGEMMVRIFRFRPIIGLYVSIGFVTGTMVGVVVVGFMNR